ncbi:putative phosphate transporter family protein [Cardiosporidium cionae]|uniref:Phosphate transporter n=1 Tax=Cardiosporidium cionae TaxID=476202 RepID=A0ABQ7J9V6_9APIC|nr:putative phosphate transporter family protein [Cardiosporidium cionae]|eukprot:KAF8820728.1 putative phosphate transporter family protein [Cardiosporidium cionae]
MAIPASTAPFLWIVIVGGIAMVVMGFMIGGNDMANTFGTSVGSKTISLMQASILAGIFVVIGSVALGATVTNAIRKNILVLSAFESDPAVLMYGMLAALIGAAFWLAVATQYELPVSTTHSIIGGIIGFGLVTGRSSIAWRGVIIIVLSWVASPVLAGILSGTVFIIIRYFVLRSPNAVSRGYKLIGILLFAVSETFTLFFLLQSPLLLNFECTQRGSSGVRIASPCIIKNWAKAQFGWAFLLATGASIVLTGIFSLFVFPYANRVMKKYGSGKEVVGSEQEDSPKTKALTLETRSVTNSTPSTSALRAYLKELPLFQDLHEQSFEGNETVSAMHTAAETFDLRTERFFSVLQILSACFDAVALGASDIANAVAPFATILAVYNAGATVNQVSVAWYILLAGGVAIAFGVAFLGYHVIKTLGIKLVTVTPSRGFTIEIATAWVILIFSNFGIPLSSTHCQVGSTVGVGLVEKREKEAMSFSYIFGKGVNYRLLGEIIVGWILTLVIAGGISAAIFSVGVYAPSFSV